MLKTVWVVALLRVMLVIAFGLLLVMQVMSVPGTLAYEAQEAPEMAALRWPLFVVLELQLLCAQVVIVCTWKLLTMVKADRIFSERSFVWVDAILWAIAVAWVPLLAVFLYVGFNAEDPGAPLLLSLVLIAGAVLGLLMVVMRALLRQATALRSDMEAVI